MNRALAGQLLTGALLLALALAFLPFTDGHWHWNPQRERLFWAIASTLAFVIAWIIGARLRQRRLRSSADNLPATADVLPVFHASQTGYAQWLAEQTAHALQQAGVPAQPRPLEQADAEQLSRLPRALFIASTTGEGDPPDSVSGFVRHMLDATLPLPQLRYGLLALGDRNYSQFCAFGHRLDTWLRQQGANPLFPPIDVDNADPAALDAWRQALAQLSGGNTLATWQEAPFHDYILSRREHLNPGSCGEAVFHIELRPANTELPHWQAGDIAEIQPQHAPGSTQPDDLRPRDYSIASLPAEGHIALLVRQSRRPDGSLGIASGWLTTHAALGSNIRLRLRRNPNFHTPTEDIPLILIGNGTGLAGLRALLRERIAQGRLRNWLIFGERQEAHDFHYRDELQNALAQGQLQHLDLAFSRDSAERIYVQQRLREQATRLASWVQQNAAIYICGSQIGMASDVDATLRQLLGDDCVQNLIETARYRRDVY